MKAKLPIIGQIRTGNDAKTRTVTKTVEKPVEKLAVGQLGAGFLELSDKGLSNYETVSERLIQAFFGWVYANVDTLAEAVSKIEFELYQMRFVKGEVEWVQIDQHEVLDLLDRFNPFTTTTDAMYLTEAYLDLAGDVFYLLDNPVRPQNMFLLDPTCMTVDPGGFKEGYNIKKFTYRTKVGRNWEEETYKPEQIIQIKKPNPGNPYRGKSTVAAAAVDIDNSNLVSELMRMFFKNGAIINMFFSSDNRITEEDIRRIETMLRQKHGGVRNAFKAFIAGGGLKPVPMQHTNREMQLLELDIQMRDKIMAMFKNTKASLGITDDVNRSNAEATLLGWKQDVIKPKMQRITDTLNEFLVPRYGNNLILTFKDPVPENREAKMLEVEKTRGVATVNERRAMIGLDPLPGEEFDTLQVVEQDDFVSEDKPSE